jgi:hypothetical protein
MAGGKQSMKNIKITYQDLLVKDGSWPNTEGQYRKPRKSFDVWFPPTWNVEIKKPIKVHGVRIEKTDPENGTGFYVS